MFKILFRILFDYHFNESEKSEESLLVVFDVIKSIGNQPPFLLSHQPIEPVHVNSLNDISFDSFELAFQTPIQINQSSPYSLFDLIKMTEKLEINLLIEMKIGFSSKIEEMKEQKVIRPQISSILQQFSSSQESFLGREETEDDSIPECSICHIEDENEIFTCPLSVSISNHPFFLDYLDFTSSIHFFSTCPHSFHYSSLEQCQSKCPICRKQFSDYLPMIQLYSELNEHQKEIVETF
jgi:hypothetical protein